MKLRNARRRVVGLIAFGIIFSTLSPNHATAVTYGSAVSDPKTSTPWVVSIWNSKTNDSKDADFVCTGTLISPHTVLTAAHCTLESGAYFVKVKSQALRDDTPYTTVSGVWKSDRYDPKNFTNDIGLLKLDDDFTGIAYPSLANAQAAKSINAKSIFTLYGWGNDQSGNLADLLRSAKLNLQDTLAAKSFKNFNPKTTISAGRKIATENVWSGACPGDSGGPLIVSINQVNVIAGVTSLGEISCLKPLPTVFSRVSYYYSDILSGLKAVELKSSVVNRTAPLAITDPQITGTIASGSTLTCEPGQWKNSVSSSVSWIAPRRLVGSSSPSAKILTSDAGQTFSCQVVISTKGGTIVRKVLSKRTASAPQLTSKPIITGADTYAPATVGSTLRCDGWNWDIPVDSETVQWFLTPQFNPTAPVNGQLIGSGKSLTLDLNILKQLKDRYVTCDVTGTRNSFNSDGITSIKLVPMDGPTITSVNVTGYSVSLGSALTCLYVASQGSNRVDISWGTSPDGVNFTPFYGANGNVLQITKQILQQGAGKVPACQVKVFNSSGEAQRIATGSLTFPSLPAIPTVSISSPTSITSSSYLTCSAQAGSGYYGQLVYQWGVTNSAASTNLVGNALTSSYSLSMNSSFLNQAAGKYLTCIATATNDAGSSSGAASVYVAPVLLPLPSLVRPISSGETTQNSTLTENITVPNISGFDPQTMSLVLNISPQVGSCSTAIPINSTPSVINCSGLQPTTTYTAQLTVSYISGGNGASQASQLLTFTTGAIQSGLYVCSTTCTGSLTNAQLNAEISDQRTIEAKSLGTVTINGSVTGTPITHSTCVGVGCSPGAAPNLPVSCGSAGTETTEVIANVSAQITTAFRYCKPNAIDVVAPTITNNSLALTGVAAILPTTGTPGTSIQVRFGASDVVGIASTSVRLVNPGNVAVSTVSGAFLAGSTTSGVYQGTISTAVSGPVNGDVYQVQAQALDAAGNSSGWVTIGTFTIQSPTLKPEFGLVTSNSSGFSVQITNYDSNFSWIASATNGALANINSSGLVSVSALTSGSSAIVTVTTSRIGYQTNLSSVSGTSTLLALPILGTPSIASVTYNSVTVIQPSQPSGWSVGWQLIAQVYSNDQSTLLGAASPGSYFTPGGSLTVTANNVGGITPDTNYQLRFAIFDSSLSRYSYGAFLAFRTAKLADLQVFTVPGGVPSISSPVGSTIKVSYRATDGLGISNAWIQVKNSVGVVIGTYSSSMVSGSNIDGTYDSYISTIIPDYSNGGIFSVEARVGGSGRIMWTWVPLGSFNLTYVVPRDVQAPIIDLSNITVTPTSLYENGRISISVPVSDNVAVSAITVRIGQLNFNLARISGTSISGVWSGTSGMNYAGGASDGYLSPGIYSPVITAIDSSGNSSSVVKNEAFILGAQGGSAQILTASAVSVSGTLMPGATIRLDANIVAYNQVISAVRFSSDGYNLNKNGLLSEVSGNSYNKNFSGTLQLALNQSPGTFNINLIAETENGRSSGVYTVQVLVGATP